MKHEKETVINGSLWLNKEHKNLLGHGRIRVLELIDQYGSISKAAKEMKMSYKAAWDAVDAMNNIADMPIVYKETGGKGGGGTRLTPYGKDLITVFKQAELEHRNFLENLTGKIQNFDKHLSFFKRMSMRTSARNQFVGIIEAVKDGSINCEIGIKVAENITIFASITQESKEELGLKEGMEAYALIKAGWVTLIETDCGKVSARNRLCGEVISFNSGAINSEVTLRLDDKNSITATVTNESAKAMELHLGSKVCAIFKSNSVIVGI